MRQINFVFLAVLLVVVAVAGGGMHLLHGFQMRGNAEALQERARRAEASNDLEKAQRSLREYLNLKREDGPAWKWYARVVDQQSAGGVGLDRVFLVQEEALRHNAGDATLERRCADLALEIGRYQDAQRHLSALFERIPKDSKGRQAAADRAELEDLLGQCERGLTGYPQAEKWFVAALEHDPGRVSCYDRLARLLRNDLRRNEAADATIKAMVDKNTKSVAPAADVDLDDATIKAIVDENTKSGLAYLYRWRYSRDFVPPALPSDLDEALKLAPDDPEVLITAAIASEQKADAAAAASEQKAEAAKARKYYEKGFKLAPKNLALAVRLAWLEWREQNPKRAEAVLRQADKARPSLELAFELADSLILQNKKDEAAQYITRLRSARRGDTEVRFLDAEILFQEKDWARAVPRLESAREALRSDVRLTARLNFMLAECYGRIGSDDQRLSALRQVAEGDTASEPVRIELARALAQAGKLDQALAMLSPLAERQPLLRLEIVRLMTQKTLRLPPDQRRWRDVEQQLEMAQKTLPKQVEGVTALRADLLAAQDRVEEARKVLTAADQRNVKYRLALAVIARKEAKFALAHQILDKAEKDLGPSLDIQLARLDCWGLEGGDAAKAAVAKLAEPRSQIPAADLPAFLDRLALTEVRLRELTLARQYWRELASLQPDNFRVRLWLFDLAVETRDRVAAVDLVREIREIEGDNGTFWRSKQAALLVDGVRRGASKDLKEARKLAVEISERRPDWWVGPTLKGEIEELAESPDQAIVYFLRAVELGNVQPSFARRLLGLLNQRNRFDEIDRLARVLRDQGAAVDEITMVKAVEAIRKQDFDGALALARQVFSEASTNASDHLTLGQFFLSANRTEEAGKEFRRAVELGPGVPETWLNYVQYLVVTKRIDQARAEIEAARKVLPADRSAFTLARCCLIVGDLAQAETLIQQLLKDKPQEPAALRFAAGLYIGQNRGDLAESYLNKLDNVTDLSASDKVWADRTRIGLLLKTGRDADRDRALRLVERALKTNPDSVEDQVLEATILGVRPGSRGDAIKILEHLGGANRLDAGQRFLLAQLYLGLPNEQKYQGEMQKLLDLKPRNPQHLAHFVNFWIVRNQFDQADRWLTELKKTDAQGLAALELEARLLDLRKRKPELLALLEARGKAMPDQIGLVADLLNRYGFAKAAEAGYKAFIAREPKQPERALLLAQFLARQDRVAEALGILEKAWSTCPPEQVAAASLPLYDAPSVNEDQRRQVGAWVSAAIQKRPEALGLSTKLGAIWIRQGRFDEAEALYRRILGSSPDNVEALNGLAWLLALRTQGKTEEALVLIDRAIKVGGPAASLVDTRAVVLIRAGQLDGAIEALSNARATDPRKPSLALHLAWAYQNGSRKDEARKAFQQAQEFGWKLANSDPLERSFMDKLRQDLGL